MDLTNKTDTKVLDEERNPVVAGSNPVGPIKNSSIVYEKTPKPL